jgi:hypothetical protein
MKKLLLALLLLPFVACKKDNDTKSSSEYILRVKCTDCVIGMPDLNFTKHGVKGTMDIPYSNDLPSVVDFAIWSNVASDTAEVTFLGENYSEVQVFYGVLKFQNDEYTNVHSFLPPKS